MSDPRIEGASSEQEEILREILAGFGSTRITSVVVRPHVPSYEEDVAPPPGPHGDAVVVATTPQDLRGDWEAQLLALVFARRSNTAGLTKVAWLTFGRGGRTLEYGQPAVAPLSTDAIDRLRRGVEAAAGDAVLERFDVLQPQGHAVALVVRVDEPHAFLRSRSELFLTSIATWRERCDGIYVEIRDSDPKPVLLVGWYHYGGFSSARRDVACCAPFLGLSRPISWKGPPACPVFGDDEASTG